jgi:hypothetical protein
VIGGVWQDWITLRGNFTAGTGMGVATVNQSESSYLDVTDFDDLVVSIDVREVTGSVVLFFQTSAAREDASFVSIGSSITLTAGATPQVVRFLAAYGPTPIARYMRWQFTGSGGTYDATFRLTFAAHAPGC